LQQRTKFRKDRSNRYGDIAIFVIFQDGGRRHFEFSKIRNFNDRSAVKLPVKSPYVCNLLTDFDEIWHDDAY